MSYLSYLVAAYAVFAAVLLWDLVVPQLQLRAARREAARRAQRQRQAQAAPSDLELSR